MAPKIKGMVLQDGDVIKYNGADHYVKSMQLVSGSSPILTIAPISPETIRITLDDLDDSQDEVTDDQSSDQI